MAKKTTLKSKITKPTKSASKVGSKKDIKNTSKISTKKTPNTKLKKTTDTKKVLDKKNTKKTIEKTPKTNTQKPKVVTQSLAKNNNKPEPKIKKIKTTLPKETSKSTPLKIKTENNITKTTKRKYTKKEDKTEAKPIVVVSKKVDVVVSNDKPRVVKSILISQPKPETGKSPYIDIANQFNIKLDWRPFTEVQPIKLIDFRLQKIYIDQYKNIIFTSKTSVEQYFRILSELRIKINEENKYFCINEAIALYLQKFINYRKRKVFFGDGKLVKLMEVILKNRDKNGDSKHLIPSSETKDKTLSDTLKKYDIEYKEAVLYKTVPSNLSDLKNVKYDMLVFFNSAAIDSLYVNFPDFVQDKTRIAIYGNSTAESVMKRKLRIDVFAPTPTMPSLADAIKKYITAGNKK